MDKSIRKMAIVNTGKGPDSMDIFKVIEYTYTIHFEGKKIIKNGDWQFKASIVNERDLMCLMRNGMPVINATIGKKDGKAKIVGSHGAMSRFKGGRALVVLSEIVYFGENNAVGYRVADANGVVKNIKKDELLKYCAKAISSGIEFPLQNASFVKNDGKPFIRRNVSEASKNSNDDGGIMTEYIVRTENKHSIVPKEQPIMKKEDKLSDVKNMYTPEQLAVIKDTRSRHNQKWRLITNPKLSAEQMRVLSKGLDKGTDISLINAPEFSVPLMKVYIEDMSYGLDISKYLNPKYKPSQVEELGIAYENGVDVAKMSNPELSTEDMAEMRVRLEKQMWSVAFEGNFDV